MNCVHNTYNNNNSNNNNNNNNNNDDSNDNIKTEFSIALFLLIALNRGNKMFKLIHNNFVISHLKL